MSTSREIQRVRKSEQRWPADVLHNGHTYQRGCMVSSETVAKLREIRRVAKYYHVEVLDAPGA